MQILANWQVTRVRTQDERVRDGGIPHDLIIRMLPDIAMMAPMPKVSTPRMGTPTAPSRIMRFVEEEWKIRLRSAGDVPMDRYLYLQSMAWKDCAWRLFNEDRSIRSAGRMVDMFNATVRIDDTGIPSCVNKVAARVGDDGAACASDGSDACECVPLQGGKPEIEQKCKVQ
jgi:hypothetical protein